MTCYNAAMRIIGLAGWSGSGKTTLLTKVIPRLVARGLTVSTLKHAHHGFDVDQPGKDSHSHRMAGATEVLVGSAKRFALVHELRGEAEPDAAARCCASSRPVDLVLVEGYKREPHPKLEVHRAAVGKPLLHPDDPAIVAIAVRRAAAAGQGAGRRSRRHRAHRRYSARARGAARRGAGAAGTRVMAQLTDDCFAFSGPLLPIDEVERLIARARRRRSPRSRRWRSTPRAAACVAHDVVAPIDLPPFDNSAVDGYAVRHADLAAKGETRLAVVERVTAGRSASARARRRRGDPHLHRRADARRRRHRVHAGGRARSRATCVIVPPGLKRGANRRLAGEDVRAGSVVLPAGRRLDAQDVALAAAVGLTALAGAPPRAGRGVLDRRRDRRARHARGRPPRSFDANRYLLAGLHRAARRRRRPISASCRTIRQRSRARSPPPRATTISC